MILITGGAGYIGSHTNKLLNSLGHETVVFDNLVYGHADFVKWGTLFKGDLLDIESVREVFSKYKIDAVVHFAAYTYVGESVTNPSKYYKNNIGGTLNLLDVMVEYNVKNIVFSSTCATYGVPEKNPIVETMPQNPINPYGFTKLAIERALKDYERAYGINFVALRYFNAAGADPDGEIGEDHNPETHLIPLVLDAALGIRKSIKVFGNDYKTNDGSCVRDYIHVCDLADAHHKALEYLFAGGRSDFFNLGNGAGYSVFEVIDTVRKVTGASFQVDVEDRREGDPDILIGSAKKAAGILSFKAQYPEIEKICLDAWNFHKKRKG